MSEPTLVYALEEPPETYRKSIFLAGPTPRDHTVASWRPEAIRHLMLSGYDGVVFIPEDRSGKWHGDKQAQIEWEERMLNLADQIVFWVPRDMETLPGLTTNVEFGRWEDSGKIVFGAPKDAPHTSYLRNYAVQYGTPAYSGLSTVMNQAAARIGDGAERTGGEHEVPLHIWNTQAFQQWYTALQAAGNRLDHARVVWTFRVGPERQIVFLWALHVDVYIASEDRHKTNEVVLARPDISSIVMYNKSDPDDPTVVLVREFRSPVSNGLGFVLENPGGSSWKPDENPLEVAAGETTEETGLHIDASRFVRHEARQLAATLSAHRAHLFSVEITDDELAWLQSQAGVAHGVVEDTERTFVEPTKLSAIRSWPFVDWSMLGMIMQVLS